MSGAPTLTRPVCRDAALAEARRVDLVVAMAVIADLLAHTLDFEGKWSPELDKAREEGRMLLKEWSAKR